MNSKIQSLITNIVIFILAVVGVVLVVYAMGNEAKIDPITLEASTDTATVSRAVSFSMGLLYITLGAIAIFTVIESLQIQKDLFIQLLDLVFLES